MQSKCRGSSSLVRAELTTDMTLMNEFTDSRQKMAFTANTLKTALEAKALKKPLTTW